ncbi:hypothetical protein BJV82DRAFT_685692 [Fennellomyces sp. T-0311]|nr:hypothetical protein BJV82DRAFT_685692 [Fennellomyces sp. T-0311]
MVEPVIKSNLTLQIERTANKLAKQIRQIEAGRDTSERKEELEQELVILQQKKIDAKLFHARKELKATFKKCRAMELQKQIKRIREAQKSAESDEAPATEETADTDKKEKKHKTRLTKDDIPRLENEHDVLKALDLDALTERSLRNKILKHEELGQNEVVKSASALAEPATPATEANQVMLDISARLLRHKAVQEQFTKLIGSIKFIMDPTAPEHKQKRQQTAGKKRKSDEPKTGTQNYTSSSMFVESLAGGSGGQERPKPKKNKSGLEWEDPDFDKYYLGEEKKKPNRMGQRNRRKLFEEQYGKEANHIKEARKARQHLGKKGAKKDTKDKPAPKPKQNMEEFHPSWQAKRQQQEMMAAALSGSAKPANKKIVFD